MFISDGTDGHGSRNFQYEGKGNVIIYINRIILGNYKI